MSTLAAPATVHTRATRSKSHPILVSSSAATTTAVPAKPTTSTDSPNVAYCLPTRKPRSSTKKADAKPTLKKSTSTSSFTASTGSGSLTKSTSSQSLAKSSAVPNSAFKGWLMSLLRISKTTSPVEPIVTKASPNPSNTKTTIVTAKPVKTVSRETQMRAASYLKLLESHREFFKGCPELDPYLIAMAFIYLQRALPLIPTEAYNTELLFFALYLAWESEEDSTVGIEGIVHYIIGPFPSSRGKDKVTRKYEIMEWKRKLNVFHVGKDKLWKALDFNTYASQPACLKALQLFPAEHEIFKRARRPEDLRKYF